APCSAMPALSTAPSTQASPSRDRQIGGALVRAARLTPPVGGTFHFENLVMPLLTKTCPKMVLPHKGGSLWVKDVFAQKFFGAGRDAAVHLSGPGTKQRITS